MADLLQSTTKEECVQNIKSTWALNSINEAIPEKLCMRGEWTIRWLRALDTLCRIMDHAVAIEFMSSIADASTSKASAVNTSNQKILYILDLERGVGNDPVVSVSPAYRERYGLADDARRAREAKKAKKMSEVAPKEDQTDVPADIDESKGEAPSTEGNEPEGLPAKITPVDSDMPDAEDGVAPEEVQTDVPADIDESKAQTPSAGGNEPGRLPAERTPDDSDMLDVEDIPDGNSAPAKHGEPVSDEPPMDGMPAQVEDGKEQIRKNNPLVAGEDAGEGQLPDVEAEGMSVITV